MDISYPAAEGFVTNSNDAIDFKLIRTVEDVENDKLIFRPQLTHQIFGDSESIFGYKDLKIKIYYTAAKLVTCLGIEYKEKADPKKFDGVEPDNIEEILSSKLPPGVLSNLDDFVKALGNEDNFYPLGELIHQFSTNEGGKERTFEIYYCNTNNKKFLSYHERLQSFILFFIDAASYIDVDDDKWRFFTIYEKYTNKDSNQAYAVCGYSTVYEYYAYPVNIRPRISQMLILPPFQRMGLGAQLLCSIYKHYIPQSNVLDITVEDPNDEFQHLRDYVDACRCSSLKAFSSENLKKGFTEEMANEAKKNLKLSKKQTRRVYEILRFQVTDTNNKAEYQAFRLDVKKRLNIPFQKETAVVKKMKPFVNSSQYQGNLEISMEQKLNILDKMYNETEAEIKEVLQRMEARPLLSN